MQFLQEQYDTRRDREAGREGARSGRTGGAEWSPLQTHLLEAWVARPVPWGTSLTASPLQPPPLPPLESNADARLAIFLFYQDNSNIKI